MGKRNIQHWTPEEDQILREIYASDLPSNRRTALFRKLLPGFNPGKIHRRARMLEIQKQVIPARPWTDEDIRQLEQGWHQIPMKELAARLNRSVSSIGNQSRVLQLPTRKFQRVESTPEIDKAIIAAYSSCRTGSCKRVAQKFDLEIGWVKHRARKLGLTRSHSYRWTPEEDRIVERYHECGGPKYIAGKLKAAGYVRSFGAIENRVRTLGMHWTSRDVYTANELAGIMGVDQKQIRRWIDSGALKAKRENKAGFHKGDEPNNYLIKHDQVRQFLIDNIACYRLANIDKYWLISCLAGNAATPRMQEKSGISGVSEMNLLM